MNARVLQQTWLRWVGRYLAGRPLDGYPRTDATWLRRAETVLTVSGRASRWHRMPGWKRTAWRMGVPSGILAELAAYVADPALTTAGNGVLAAGGVTLATRKGIRHARKRAYTRRTVRPLASALAPFAELPEAEVFRNLKLPGPLADVGTGQITVPLADHHGGQSAKIKDIERIVTQRLGGEWDPAVNLRQHPFYVHFSPRPAPPEKVTLSMVREAIEATTQDRPILGLGTRAEILKLDFTGEIAHLAASIGTGGGKSSFLRLLVSQFAHHGVRDFTVCDVKMVSLQGMEPVPGLHIHRHVEEIWEAIAADRAEMDRRYSILLKNPGRRFPRKVLILEEQNAFALETAIVWREMRSKKDPAMAPVWTDIALLLLKARQVNMNLIGVYQRMSAEASGGGSLRDQYGLKMLSRFSPQAWDTLVGTRPRGVSSAIPGRAIAVLGGIHRSVQVPFVSVDEALDLATSGPDVPVESGDTHEVTPMTRRDGTPQPQRFTLAEAARQDWCTVSYEALKQRVGRARRAGTLAVTDQTYTQEELAGFAARQREEIS